MRREGPVTARHIFVAVAMVFLVNAQLTWWIVYTLRENRTRLRLEREAMVDAARLHAIGVEERLRSREAAFERWLLGDRAASTGFETHELRRADPSCAAGWSLQDGRPVLTVATEEGCWYAVMDPVASAALAVTPADLELTSSPVEGPPAVALPAPFDGWLVRPAGEHWQGLLDVYRRRIAMVVSEGGFFAIVILVVLTLLWKSFRREVELERQHQGFLSAITHELKSPLAGVRLSLETVLRGRADSDTSRRFLTNALTDTERLQGLVEKVLEVTRYSRGHASLRPRAVDLGVVVADAVAAFGPRAAAAEARIETDLATDLVVEADPEALAIAVSNLLENAVKYGGRPPRIGIRLTEEGGQAVLDVQDNGPGIPESDREHVFRRFWRAGNELTRTTHGTGLGLHLVHQIVTAHRGSVAVHSSEDHGSAFRITLPNAGPAEDDAS